MLGQYLEGNFSVQAAVFCEIAFAHTPLADLLKNLVVADGLADHEGPPAIDRFALDVTPLAAKDNQCWQKVFSTVVPLTASYGREPPSIGLLV